MKPVEFPEQNVVFAKDQPQYQPLPAFKAPDGEVITCWKATWRERIYLFLTGKLWWSCQTFNQPLQPQYPFVGRPFGPVRLIEEWLFETEAAAWKLLWRKLTRGLQK
jgi:hypothetical protein